MQVRDKVLHVFKRELPVAVVVEDDNGKVEVQELAPAGKHRLGTRMQRASEILKQVVEMRN